MTYLSSAKVICDSISPLGVRLSTVEFKIPRKVLAELNTHRDFSRNSASSRAIPVAKQLASVMDEPFVPSEWGKNKPGMSADEVLSPMEEIEAERLWLEARDNAVNSAKALMELGVHKQIANRILEPFMYHTVIITATEWGNYFGLRLSSAADPDIRIPSEMLKSALDLSIPKPVGYSEWHLPYIQDDERSIPTADLVRISSARCARVSYMTHEGTRDPFKDLILYKKLEGPGHMSPMEHPATPLESTTERSGNFRGWHQFRKSIAFESDFSLRE
jgi:hypothetical protein